MLARILSWLKRPAPIVRSEEPAATVAVAADDVHQAEPGEGHHPACRGAHGVCPSCGMVCAVPVRGSNRAMCTLCFRPFDG
jgi:hypothetical protein